MKKIFFILTVLAYSYLTNAQVQTPNGSNILASPGNDINFPLQKRLDTDAVYRAKSGVIEVIMPSNGYTSSTEQYNCHGYAWHMHPNAALTEYTWMEQIVGNIEKYWLDGSYVEVTGEIHPGIVLYTDPSHSAITTSTPGEYISKWGPNPLIRHKWNNLEGFIMNQTTLRYFVKTSHIGNVVPYASIGINGPDSINNATNYSLNITPGQNVLWSPTSNNYFTVSTNDTQATVTPTALGISGNQSMTLSAMVKGKTFTKNIKVLPAKISGPYHLCNGNNYTFTAVAPNGITWGQSANLTVTQGANNTATVKGTSSGAGWVSINLGGQVLDKVDVWVGLPVITGLSGPLNPQTYTPYSFTVLKHAVDKPTSYYFNVSGGNYYMETGGQNWEHVAYITFYEEETYTVTAIAYNPCGQSNVYYTYVNVGSRGGLAYAYPNPVSDMLYIDLDIFAEQQGHNITERQRQNLTYDVRLYDMQGYLQRQQKAMGGIIQFNVANLPAGNYFLHIYDGLSNVPTVLQIIVRR